MRRLVPALALAPLLMGCVTFQANRDDTSAATFFATPTLYEESRRLVPWTTLNGYLEAANGGTGKALKIVAGVETSAAFDRPVGVSARGGSVYVVDGGTHALYRFRWQIEGHDSPEHLLAEHEGLSHPSLDRVLFLSDVGEIADVYVSPQEDIYLAEVDGRVIRYDRDGTQMQVFESEKHLNRPVAVTVDRRNARVFVADSYFDHILVFNMAGKPLYRIGQRGDGRGQFRNIRDMVQGRLGLYVIDGFNRRIQVYGLNGTLITTFGKNAFNDGVGIAVDSDDRVYVADRFEHELVVFKDGEVVERLGRRGRDPGEFDSPTNIWCEEQYLYVADTNNRRVQILRVLPEGALQAEAAKGSG